MATYRKSSPYFTTNINNTYLELLNLRPVTQDPEDVEYVIENQYRHRPDLLAYDLYGDPKLWWVFTLRNRSILKDPIYDFLPGTTIKVPKKENVDATVATTKSN
jgi:hypothetical protein